MAIELTEKAAAEVKRLMSGEEDNPQYLRVGVESGGCAGFSYTLGFENTKYEDDIVSENHGVSVLVSGKLTPYLDGTNIDFESMKGFAFRNPQSCRGCGCGKSFGTKEPGDCGGCG